jgi:plasmid stability protein
MGQIVIRNIDDMVLDALRRRAAEAGTSTEEEARRALTASVGLNRDEAVRRLDAVRKKIGRVKGATTLEILCEDRRRDGS